MTRPKRSFTAYLLLGALAGAGVIALLVAVYAGLFIGIPVAEEQGIGVGHVFTVAGLALGVSLLAGVPLALLMALGAMAGRAIGARWGTRGEIAGVAIGMAVFTLILAWLAAGSGMYTSFLGGVVLVIGLIAAGLTALAMWRYHRRAAPLAVAPVAPVA